MSRNKRIQMTALLLLLSLTLSACGQKNQIQEGTSEAAGTQASDENPSKGMGSSLLGEVKLSGDKDEMLLMKETGEENVAVYATKEVITGSMIANSKLKAEVIYLEEEEISVKAKYGTLRFGGFTVNTYQPLKQGDVIAIYGEVIDANLFAELEIRIALAQKNGDTEEEKRLTDLVLDMHRAEEAHEIYAPFDGMLTGIERLYNGWNMGTEGKIGTIASLERSLLSVENPNGIYKYGQKVTIEATYEGNKVTAFGKVITASQKGISGQFVSDAALIAVNEGDEYIYNASDIMTSVEATRIDNVSLIEVSAVKFDNGIPYVLIEGENGIFRKTFFYAGKKNSQYYWAVDGITKDMKIIFK